MLITPLNDIRLISSVTLVLLLGLALIGMEWEARAQLALLGILVVAIVNFFVGSLMPPTVEQRSKGYIGYSGESWVV